MPAFSSNDRIFAGQPESLNELPEIISLQFCKRF